MVSKGLVIGVVILIILAIAAASMLAARQQAQQPSSSQQSPSATPSTTAVPERFNIAIEDGTSWHFSPMVILAVSGAPISVYVTNNGASAHTFTINGTGSTYLADSGSIAPGSSVFVNFTVPGPGNYTYYSRLPGDAQKGLEGQFIVNPENPTNQS